MSRDDLVRELERKFWRDTRDIGVSLGAAEAAREPAQIETDTATARATLEAAVFFIIGSTEVRDLPLSELEFRDRLVRSVLLAKPTDKAVRSLTSNAAPRLARRFTAKIPAVTYKPVNDLVGYRLITKRGIEDLATSGLGIAIGFGANSLFAWHVIRASRREFEKYSALPDLEGVIVEEGTDSFVTEDEGSPRRGGGAD